jgi:Na+-driven multidrug efflux pump
LSYNFGQLLILRMVSSLGTETLAAYNLVLTISRYVFITGISIGSAAQIKVGYYVGAGQPDEAYHRVWRYFGLGALVSFVLILVVFVFKTPIISVFTHNPDIAATVAAVFLVSVFYEPGRNFNTIIIPSLKGAGDVRFPVLVGMCFMWGVGVVGAYILGIALHWGLVGIWIAMACDEWSRGLVMAGRWRSGAWRGKSLVKA